MTKLYTICCCDTGSKKSLRHSRGRSQNPCGNSIQAEAKALLDCFRSTSIIMIGVSYRHPQWHDRGQICRRLTEDNPHCLLYHLPRLSDKLERPPPNSLQICLVIADVQIIGSDLSGYRHVSELSNQSSSRRRRKTL